MAQSSYTTSRDVTLLDGLKTKRGIERDGYTPCENLAAEPVDNRGEMSAKM
jgi:hypothetical protein